MSRPKMQFILAQRHSPELAARKGTWSAPCDLCGQNCTLGPGSAAVRSCFPDAKVICTVCGEKTEIDRRNPFDGISPRVHPHRPENYQGPLCHHPLDIPGEWIPVIEERKDREVLARRFLPARFCDDCARKLTIEAFRPSQSTTAPTNVRLLWVRAGDLERLFTPAHEAPQPFARRMNG